MTGCGGAPTTNFVRSLRDDDPHREKYFIVGVDQDVYTVHRSECDVSYLGPSAKDEHYIDYLLEIIRKERIVFLHTQPEIEVYTVGKYRTRVTEAGCRLLMPRQETIEILRDKLKSYLVWSRAGIAVPRNMEIGSEEDLQKAFSVFGENIWIRETVGAAGKGSLSRPSYVLAKAWIDYRKGWGHTVAAEHLSARTTTWQSLWYGGKLVVGQGRERISWEMGNRTQSGVTGITGTGKIVNDPAVAALAVRCITAADEKPHGIFSVDFTYDKKGIPNPTEINIGKFFTTHHFITRAGCNMPAIMVALAFGEYQGGYGIVNPCKEGLFWVRGMDREPMMVAESEITGMQKNYENLMRSLQL